MGTAVLSFPDGMAMASHGMQQRRSSSGRPAAAAWAGGQLLLIIMLIMAVGGPGGAPDLSPLVSSAHDLYQKADGRRCTCVHAPVLGC
jgi:hypothetical protein